MLYPSSITGWEDEGMRPIGEIAQDLETGRATSRALTEDALGRIEDPDGEGPRAFIRVFAEPARAAGSLPLRGAL